MKLRKFDGTSSISRRDRVPPIWLLVRSTRGASPVTTRFSCTPATVSFSSSVTVEPGASTIPVRVALPNPAIVTTTS
ncbi:MAG: hypothetical protein KA371_03820 [Acidobacteria bacterium]|nr:hypothetical protein [Acidobacteriota bacterium]